MAEIPKAALTHFANVTRDNGMPAKGHWPTGPHGSVSRSELRSRLKQWNIGTAEEREAWIVELTGGPAPEVSK